MLITVARPLRAAGCTVNARVLDDGTLSVGLLNQPISDLSILEGTPISRLAVQSTKVCDLRPVRTMKLTFLDLWDTPVTDLSPLRGLPLTSINLGATNVTDLSPLEGMPLADFFADRAAFTDFAPLAKCPTLRNIHLPRPNPGALPQNIEPLRNLPKLERISFQYDWSTGPICTAKDFWAHWDGLGWLRALQDGEFKFTAKQLESGQWRVSLGHETRFNDCSIFKGAHLVWLNLENTGVADLSPLRDIPLEVLDTGRTRVTDVSTLRGSTLARSLKVFSLYDTRVTDFSPVAECVNLTGFVACKTSLQDIGFFRELKACTGVFFTNTLVTDVSALSEMPSLRGIALPFGAREVEKLRALPDLRVITYDYEGQQKQTAEQFWQMHDELPWFAELGAKGIIAKTIRRADGLWMVDFHKHPIADLAPLRGSRIGYLDIGGSPITDLTPLRGLPLDVLAINDTKVTDLAPLAGMRLTLLNLSRTTVKDISVVRGMPLQEIYMGDGAPVDLEPLHHTDTLVLMNLAWGSKNLEGLRRLPKVERIGYGWDDKLSRVDTSAAEFWQIHDELPWVGELRAKGIKVDASRREDGRWVVKLNDKRFSDCSIFKGAQIAVLSLNGTSVTDLGPLRGLLLSHLDISNTSIEDVSPLEGMPLTSLNMQTTKVTDLGPLRGMKLTSLFTCDSPVTDLSSLRGLPLTYLNISNCPVKDLSPLEEMPLMTFHAWKCRVLSDYTPLARIQTLREILLGPIDAEAPRMEIEALRGLPNVESLSFQVENGRPVTTAKEFWAEFDRKKKP